MSDAPTLSKISSLAAPTPEDESALRAMTPEERRTVLAAHLAESEQDITEGRFIVLETDDDITAYFQAKREKYADTPI